MSERSESNQNVFTTFFFDLRRVNMLFISDYLCDIKKCIILEINEKIT